MTLCPMVGWYFDDYMYQIMDDIHDKDFTAVVDGLPIFGFLPEHCRFSSVDVGCDSLPTGVLQISKELLPTDQNFTARRPFPLSNCALL